jgi:hypothetical protein
MKTFLIFFLFFLAHSQETEGNIFEVMDSGLTESETAEQATNVEENPEIDSSSSSDSLASVTLEDLKSQNEALKSEEQDLILLLQDAEAKLEMYKSKYYSAENEIEQEIQETQKYLEELQHKKKIEEEEKEDQENEEDDEDDEDESIDVSISLIFVVGIGFVFLFLHGLKTVIGFSLESFLNPAFYSLFVDLTILLVICSAVALCDYVEVFDEDTIDYEILTLGVAIFTLFWLVSGLWLILASQSFSKYWYFHEKECRDFRNLNHMLQEAQIEMQNGRVPKNLKSLYRDLQYVIMRQLFICPTFLPPVTETYLRVDFNFPEYLSRGLANILDQVFQINILGYIFIIFLVLAWRVLLFCDEKKQFIALWAYPILILVICVSILLKLKGIYIDLVPAPTDEFMLNLPKDNFGRSPEMNEDILPKPRYLEGSLTGKETFTCFGSELHPLKLTWAYILRSTYPNRHELLFWADKYGVELIISLLQAICVSLTLWITLVILFYIPFLIEMWENYSILLIILCFLLWGGLSLYLVPEILRLLTLTSKIEMKKDRKLIEDVIENQKNEQGRVIHRIYRQFKMIYRERYDRPADNEDQIIRDSALEAFHLCKDPESGTVSMFDLEDLIAMCGVKLNDDELRLFAKECKTKSLNEVDSEEFVKGALTLFRSRKLRPEIVVRDVLQSYFLELTGKTIKEVNLDDLKQFFNHFWWHFTDDDIQDFLWETRFILGDVGTVPISELSAMVRNTIKDYSH